LLGLVASGIDPAAKAVEGDSFASIVERYLSRQQAKMKSRSFKEVQRHLRKHSAPLHLLLLPAITRREIAEILASVESASGGVTRNRVRSSLSALWTWAIQEGLVEHNVVTGAGKADEGGSRERVLSDAEIRKLWLALGNDPVSDAIRLLLLTGQRRSEIGGLRWSEINLQEGVLVLALQMVYRGEVKLSAQQMRAAIEVLSFEEPKLATVGVAHLTGQDFAAMLDRAIARSLAGPPPKLIEAQAFEIEPEQ